MSIATVFCRRVAIGRVHKVLPTLYNFSRTNCNQFNPRVCKSTGASGNQEQVDWG